MCSTTSRIARVALLVGISLSCRTAEADLVTGVVVRQGSLAPIPGAKVTLQTSLIHTTTAADGTFSLAIPAGPGNVLVGASKGYFNAGVTVTSPSSGVQIVLPPVPQENSAAYAFVSPETCSTCHPNQYAQWTGSPMSRGGTNTWVHDIYNGMGTPGGMGGFVYTRDSIYSSTNPNSECASCHQPESWIPTPFSRMQGPQDAGYPSMATQHGVSCEVCHKMADIDVTKVNFPGIFPGVVIYTRPGGTPPHQVQYGLLGDTTFNSTFMMRASYQPQLMAEVCGACHQDRSDPAENHTYTGPVSEPTYIEWAESPYSDPNSPYYANCVTCHMPSNGDTVFCSFLDPPLVRDPSLIGSHDIRGTTPGYLENAVTLNMSANIVGSTLRVDVDLTNTAAGHHVPTGVTTRNMLLLVEAWPDGMDPVTDILPFTGQQTVHPLGGLGDPSQGYYAGRPGKLYAKVNHDAQGNSPTFFTDATGIVFDNRLAALQSDATSYTFTLPPAAGDIRVRARLLYRRAWRALVDAKQWTQDGHGNALGDIQPPHFGFLMRLTETVLPHCAGPGSGDVNGDGVVNGLDIEGFVNELLNHPQGPATTAFCAANIQNDQSVDMNDLGLFVSTLLHS